MSLRVMTWAWSVHLAPAPKLVLMALADEADDNGYCFPGHRRIAHKCSIGERTVRRILGNLEKAGYLKVEARYRSDRSRTSNGYRLASVDPPAKLARGEGAGDHGPRTPVTRGQGLGVQVTTTYPLSNPSPQHATEAAETEVNHTRGAGGGCDWDFPEGLSAGQVGALYDVVAGLDPSQVQQILDELAGRLKVGRITNPIRYCAALAERAKRGQFTPELGIRIAEIRSARLQQLERDSAGSTVDPVALQAMLLRLPEDLRISLERMKKRAQQPPDDPPPNCQAAGES